MLMFKYIFLYNAGWEAVCRGDESNKQ